MNTLIKIGIAAGLIGLFVWGQTKKAIANFSVDVIGIGKPTLKNFLLTVPLQLRLNNPAPLAINIDTIIADIYVLKNNSYVKAGTVNQSLSIPSGNTVQTLYPVVNLSTLFGGNVLETTQFVTNTLTRKQLSLKVDASAIYNGVALPKQSFTETVMLG